MKKVVFHIVTIKSVDKVDAILQFYRLKGVNIQTDEKGLKPMCDIVAIGDLMLLFSLANSLGVNNTLCVVKAIADPSIIELNNQPKLF